MIYNKNSLLHQLTATRFSMWDIHLYLDSHPCDETAAALLEKYREKYKYLLSNYEAQYGALSHDRASGNDWTKGPWPWENRGDC